MVRVLQDRYGLRKRKEADAEHDAGGRRRSQSRSASRGERRLAFDRQPLALDSPELR